MDQYSYDVRITKWESLIREANSSGISKTEWCQLHGISKYKFYYWQRKVRARAGAGLQAKTVGCNDPLKSEPASSLVELTLPAIEPPELETTPLPHGLNTQIDHTAELLLRVGAYEIQVNSPAAEETLCMVMRVLRNA